MAPPARLSDGYRMYMLFASAEVGFVFLPVFVHMLVLLLTDPRGDHRSLFESPDLLYAAIVLPGISVCKYLVSYLSSHERNVSRFTFLFRVLLAGLLVSTSAIVLGLFFANSVHTGWWPAIEVVFAIAGVPVFLLASSDYYRLIHERDN